MKEMFELGLEDEYGYGYKKTLFDFRFCSMSFFETVTSERNIKKM